MENKITTNKLDDKHKYQIIQMLAAFEKPTAIVEHLKAQFDIEVSERTTLSKRLMKPAMNRPVRTRMRGGVGSGGEKPPLTRLDTIIL